MDIKLDKNVVKMVMSSKEEELMPSIGWEGKKEIPVLITNVETKIPKGHPVIFKMVPIDEGKVTAVFIFLTVGEQLWTVFNPANTYYRLFLKAMTEADKLAICFPNKKAISIKTTEEMKKAARILLDTIEEFQWDSEEFAEALEKIAENYTLEDIEMIAVQEWKKRTGQEKEN
ncbi:hypothetical protein [Aquifex aeolicus]|uniref:Uncharacterized protein aq_aa22 n=1 Tax=Aquifex aeolicus (strain VF5) TaxID=224324 RepID=YZ22_AQUAE|nr:hypothetical protein [Aquifex aeolicus]O66413.1 RecName: Full=Uncharacterized protein aq_aa22 [Aquifex aeolicus VF5]AAC07965.1 putative protein [Aquifex aeolicus VF5]